VGRALAILALLTAALAGPLGAQRIVSHAPDSARAGSRFVFYLHGRIVEDQGDTAVSPDYGRYEYAGILNALSGADRIVVSERRAPNTDPEVYADSVVRQVRRLIAGGIRPVDITVVGASKGAVITMLVSTRLTNSVRYVVLANCNDYVFRNFPLRLHGHVLSIYEWSDSLGQSCRPLFERSPELGDREEIRLSTGLRHGFIFRPRDEWVRPTVSWARGERLAR
jgi:hypothetical protein